MWDGVVGHGYHGPRSPRILDFRAWASGSMVGIVESPQVNPGNEKPGVASHLVAGFLSLQKSGLTAVRCT